MKCAESSPKIGSAFGKSSTKGLRFRNLAFPNGTEVHRVFPDGTHELFADGFDGPIGLVFDADSNLYVSQLSRSSPIPSLVTQIVSNTRLVRI